MDTGLDEKVTFDERGFIGPFKVYAPDEARALSRELRANNASSKHALYGANPVNYDRHFDIPELARHIAHPEIVRRLKLILGNDILCWRTEWFPKFPGTAGTEWHAVRDYSYANGVPQISPTQESDASFFDLTAWTAWTEATKEVGCMKFIPGSHKRALFDEHKPTATGRKLGYKALEAGTEFFGYKFAEFKIDPGWDPDAEEVVTLEMQPGECVIFTARCVHGSWPNTSQRKTRLGIAARYVPAHVRVYADQHEFVAHGHVHNLADYGSALIAGEDRFGHNRIRAMSNTGLWFVPEARAASVLSEADVRAQVKRIWKDVLQVDDVSAQDDFMDDLGGHSLLVARVKALLDDVLQQSIPLPELFRHTTLESLTSYLLQRLRRPAQQAIGSCSGDEAACSQQPAAARRAERVETVSALGKD